MKCVSQRFRSGLESPDNGEPVVVSSAQLEEPELLAILDAIYTTSMSVTLIVKCTEIINWFAGGNCKQRKVGSIMHEDAASPRVDM